MERYVIAKFKQGGNGRHYSAWRQRMMKMTRQERRSAAEGALEKAKEVLDYGPDE